MNQVWGCRCSSGNNKPRIHMRFGSVYSRFIDLLHVFIEIASKLAVMQQYDATEVLNLWSQRHILKAFFENCAQNQQFLLETVPSNILSSYCQQMAARDE